jgi:phosphatidylethanolamine/phosphatidyl-N-methylethanolamine N-methyltransferase
VTDLDNAAIRSAYRRYAPMYDWAFGPVLDSGRDALAEELQALAPKRILEVGVGTGRALARCAASELQCGLDLSMDMLQRAAAVLPGETDRAVPLICGDAEKLPFASQSFDCVTLPYVLSVTPSPQMLLLEAQRVCTSGGHILVLNHFRSGSLLGLLERVLSPFAKSMGFRPNLDSAQLLAGRHWSILKERRVNVFNLTKLVVLRNCPPIAPTEGDARRET